MNKGNQSALWILAGLGLVILLSTPKQVVDPLPSGSKSITKTVSETLPNIRAAYKQAFEEAARKSVWALPDQPEADGEGQA